MITISLAIFLLLTAAFVSLEREREVLDPSSQSLSSGHNQMEMLVYVVFVVIAVRDHKLLSL